MKVGQGMERFRTTVKREGVEIGDLPFLEELWAVRYDDAQAEIARLTAELDGLKLAIEKAGDAFGDYRHRAEKAEAALAAERANTAAAVAGAYEAAAERIKALKGSGDGDLYDGGWFNAMVQAAAQVRALTPAHATAALAARDKATRGQALREAVWQVRSSVPGHMLVADTERICAAILALIEKETSA